ncbi:E3 ubiquitin-protein ligase TRIM71-like [Oopsacas minuta]|uniref:E3 ubiquitin-protein ligase TRIM71-like n=1 Tax=Oopsacas minuta TaxID=111878 RepID=A0AAV7JPU4_9METZ|nr:E3 ubiquitin-protein ligase TRIM71-like [Oopsacas minuta]
MATRIVDFPPTEPQYDTDNVDFSKRQQHFNDVTFTCHFCQQSVKRATFLSCLHSFCKTCIDEKVEQEETESIQCTLCPSYDNDSLELQSNPLPELINKLKQLKTTDNLRCTDCVSGDTSEAAVAFCVECNATICKIDLKSHEKYNMGHLILQLHTLQESSVQDILTSIQNYTRDSSIGTKEDHPDSEDKDIPITSSTNKLQEECILEAKSRISQLEDRKSNLEIKWNEQTTQVLTFFQQMCKQLETRKEDLLGELSHNYQTLITPLEDSIQQLEQMITYTGYVGMLNSFSVNVNQQTEQDIQKTLNKFLTVHTVDNPFIPEKHKSYKVTSSQMLIPSDVTYNSTTKVYYALFYSHWKTYKQIHNVLTKQQVIKVTIPAAFQTNSSIALLYNSVVIMSGNILYVYSEKGEILRQLDLNKIGTILNPKIYTFYGNNSVYIACIDSPNINKVNTQTGVKENIINLTSSGNLGNVCFVDIVRSTTNSNLLLILHTATAKIGAKYNETRTKGDFNRGFYCHSFEQDSSTSNKTQYYLQVCNINNLQYTGSYRISQILSLSCCITTFNDRIYVLDVCNGSVHSYKLNQMQADEEYRRPMDFKQYYQHINLNQDSVYLNSLPKCTNIDGKILTNTMIRAFSDETNEHIMLLSGGEIHFIS